MNNLHARNLKEVRPAGQSKAAAIQTQGASPDCRCSSAGQQSGMGVSPMCPEIAQTTGETPVPLSARLAIYRQFGDAPPDAAGNSQMRPAGFAALHPLHHPFV
jgi:hypothetical protein